MLEFVVPSSLAKGFRSTLLPMFMGSEVDRKPLAIEDVVGMEDQKLPKMRI